ncbi:hypothetical protein W97_07817 [Coniosporium apollinis CBS 100218]|uniref:Peptidase S53 domain-containing protein n=1 Tax=Coniosporium apollinis (strain CBS 100218) TaxID=1168221 RepID=R7Z3F8_CONA1|nr:uncharacterized protein W97_07817 [Coniosporium apollinis CBS 100218]EON68559.1 hypothetical protein W97_07817 [Coniosporium apollinis CBS 100218]
MGRGFPDLAAQALSFPVVDQGVEVLVGGTSASAPVVAAIVGLLNSARLSANKPPLGFLNPWLYSEGYRALTDIVEGGSTGCMLNELGEPETPFVPYASCNATVGWDAVTGFGTPDFGKMLKLAMRREERRPWRRG